MTTNPPLDWGFSPEQKAKIAHWQRTKQQLDTLKELEMQLRKEVVAMGWPQLTTTPQAGTFYRELGAGAQLQLKQDFTYNVAMTTDDIVQTVSGPLASVLLHFPPQAQRLLIKFKPQIDVRNYKALAPQEKHLFNDVLTIKPSAPTIDIIEPKQ